MADASRIAGPIIRWLDYGYEGWQPDSFPSIEAAVRADNYGSRAVITRLIDFRIVEARGDQPDSDPPIPNSATPQGA